MKVDHKYDSVAPGRCGNIFKVYPDNKFHEAYMGPSWGRQDPAGAHVPSGLFSNTYYR